MTRLLRVTLLGSLLLSLPAAARAQSESDSAHVLHGLWKMSIRHPRLGVVHGLIQETDASYINHVKVYHPQGVRTLTLNSFDSKGDSVFADFPSLDSIEKTSWLRAKWAPDRSRIIGRWRDRDDREHPIMLERVRPRMRVHAVAGIENSALDYAGMKDEWKYASARGNLPRIRIDIDGWNLPQHANPHTNWWGVDGIHTSIDDSLIFLHIYEGTRRGDSLRVYAWLEKGARPGLKRLTIEGSTVEFELKFENYEAPAEEVAVKTLRFVRKVRDGYVEADSGLMHGETFHVEASLARPAQVEHVVARLTWLQGQDTVRLGVADESRLIFRSAALRVEAPPPAGP